MKNMNLNRLPKVSLRTDFFRIKLKKDYRVIYLVYNKVDYISAAAENFINYIAINKINL